MKVDEADGPLQIIKLILCCFGHTATAASTELRSKKKNWSWTRTSASSFAWQLAKVYGLTVFWWCVLPVPWQSFAKSISWNLKNLGNTLTDNLLKEESCMWRCIRAVTIAMFKILEIKHCNLIVICPGQSSSWVVFALIDASFGKLQ